MRPLLSPQFNMATGAHDTKSPNRGASSKEFTLDLNAIENNFLTITFEDFAVGHNYSVSISYRKPDGYYSFVKVNDYVNSDYSYINSQLTVNSPEAVTVQLEISR